MSDDQQTEWIEIIDPKSRQRMFANLITGICAWEVPPHMPVKRMEENQWWELFDNNTRKQYYYNPMTMDTVWNRPKFGDIIPLARLQMLKQNTELVSGSSGLAPEMPMFKNHAAASSSSSTPQTRRKHHSTKSADVTHEFSYSNFYNDLSNQLDNIPSGSGYTVNSHSNGSSLHRSDKKGRAPSTCSVKSQNSTKSRYNNCIQEMLASQCVQQSETEITPILTRANIPTNSKDAGSYSPSSSLSSCGQSTDMLSQTTSTSFMSKELASTKPRETPTPTERIECWAKDPPKNPLIDPTDKKIKKPAHQVFKLLSSYMGDRKMKTTPEQVVLSILELRPKYTPNFTDEIFLQLMKQLTENPKPDSTRRGWELFGILLVFFAPNSPEIHQRSIAFVEANSDSLLDSPEVSISHYAKHCLKRLQLPINNLKPSIAAISQARFNIFNPSKFGTPLEELMELQARDYPDLKVPWIQTTLTSLVFETGAEQTEGVFRCAADPDQLQTVMAQLDQNIKPRVRESHVPAVLLKQWFRQLPNPLIPNALYDKCLSVCCQPESACRIVDQLPAINRLVLCSLLQLLHRMLNEETVRITKMDVWNLSLVFAPNILRCVSTDPHVMFGNSRKEMEFMKTLILNYDTSFMHSSD